MAAFIEGTSACISHFHAAIYDLTTNLDEKEVSALKFLCKRILSKSQRENVTALGLFEILEECGKISENDHEVVITLLDHIKREDLKKRFLQELEPGSGQSPATQRPNLSFSNSSALSPQAGLKTPSHFTPSPVSQAKPGLFEGIPKPVLRSVSEHPSSNDPSPGAYNVDGTPNISSGSQRMHKFASTPSLQNPPQGQSSNQSFRPKGAAASVGEDKSNNSGQNLNTSGNKASGVRSERQNPDGWLQGEGLMKKLSLQDSPESKKAGGSPGLPEDDIETDSPSLVVRESNVSRQLRPSQGGASATPRVTPETDSVGSHPREMPSSHQGQGPTAWPLGNPSPETPNRSQQVQEQRHPHGMPSPDQGQGSTVWDLVDLSTDSPSRIRQQGDGRQLPGLSLDERVRRMDQMFDQQEARKEARAAAQARPNLREYQKELAERPLRAFENHIICAPTGSGKTLTAAYICYQYWTWFRENVFHKHFKTLFIVNMRHLTVQQRDAFQSYFPNKQAVRTIAEQQTFTDALKLDKQMPAVLMLTAQIFVNALRSKAIDIKDLDMIIFDECHHTDMKHPYNEIMKAYLKKKQTLPQPQKVGVSGAGLPFIIGLSASLGVGSEALSHLLTLCGNMDSKGVVRVLRNEEELNRHVNAPEQDTIERVSSRAANDRQFADLLEALMAQIEDQLPEIEEHPLPSRSSQLYESETMRRLTEAQKSSHRTAVIVYMYLYEYNRVLMLYDDLRVTDGLKHLETFHVQERRLKSANEELIPTEEYCQTLFNLNLQEMTRLSNNEEEHSNEKLGRLAFLLHKMFSEKPDSKGIILVRMKVATTALSEFIRKSTLLQSLPCRVIPLRFVGQGDIEQDCMTESQQKTVLKNFKQDDGCNVLVATDIAQEGLDMPACNFVIRYNFVSNEIGTVQSKGRARAEGSQCFIIVECGSLNEKREFENRHKVEKMKEAMEELEAMTEDEQLDKITERQIEILEKIRRADEEAERQQALVNLDRITIHCKECPALVCKASELRRKGDGGHVTCISPEFKRWVKEIRYKKVQRYRDTETVGLISCGTVDCGNQFGTMQKFLNLDPPDGYAMKAESFTVHFERGGVKTPKIWKKAGFEIITD